MPICATRRPRRGRNASSEGEVAGYLAEAGLSGAAFETLLPEPGDSARLAVSLWLGTDARIQGDFPLSSDMMSLSA